MDCMEIDIKDSLLNQKTQIDNNFLSAIDDQKNIISEIYLLINCYQKRGKEFEFDELLQEITHDAFASIYFCLQGFYRQSYISLRCILEMGISLFQFKDNYYTYLLWKNNKKDIRWSVLNGEDEGILTDKYWGLFYEGDFKTYNETISLCYRECSEYVHGKDSYLRELKDFQVKYNNKICKDILIMCKKIISILVIGPSIRFGNQSDEFTNRVNDLFKEYEVN